MNETVQLELMDAGQFIVTYAAEGSTHIFNTRDALAFFGVRDLKALPKKLELEMTWELH